MEATAAQQALEQRLAHAGTALQQAERRASLELMAAASHVEQRQKEFDIRLRQEVAKSEDLQRDLADMRTTSEQAQRQLLEEAADLRQQARAYEARTEERFAKERVAQETALARLQEKIGLLRDELRLAVEARDRQRSEIEQLHAELETLDYELEGTRRDREVLRTEVPLLQNQLDQSRAENRRQFEDTPYGMCRCRPDGAIMHVNHALVELLGYRTADEVRSLDFATAVFESAEDLPWLVKRCLGSAKRESVETAWRRKDGGHLIVRLLALAVAPEAIEIVVEDITNLRALEGRLRQAQRMEAVARLASEVAVTCDNLLREVSQDGQDWLAAIGGSTALRRQGEQLLAEVTRVASFLQEITVYGKKEASAREPVDVNRVLRDLAPVLRSVAGDNIELVLPKTSSPVTVDVEAERIERVLVNVAGYGRERMAFGGRLMIELATVVADGPFIEQYPNVRPGAHALITVTETRRAATPYWPIELQDKQHAPSSKRSTSDRPGVDLGALQSIIRDCGGHLWMTAEPGNMELKIRLPQPVLNPAGHSRASGVRSGRGLSTARWFEH
jgi:PAS domain S-box-containing protein